jgi:hypothetical protein
MVHCLVDDVLKVMKTQLEGLNMKTVLLKHWLTRRIYHKISQSRVQIRFEVGKKTLRNAMDRRKTVRKV